MFGVTATEHLPQAGYAAAASAEVYARMQHKARLALAAGFGVIADAASVVALPEQMDFVTAAAFPITYATSYHALKDRGQLRSGEALLVLGAAGGVGLAAVEIGKIMGARVIACASSDEKLALAREHGADALINYAASDLRERIREVTAGKGVDVVYDPVGGGYAEPALRSLAAGGRYLVIGFASGEIPRIALNLLLLTVISQRAPAELIRAAAAWRPR